MRLFSIKTIHQLDEDFNKVETRKQVFLFGKAIYTTGNLLALNPNL